jgi:hypothetical protein
VGLYIGRTCKCGGEVMHILQLLRNRLKLVLCVGLFLMLLVFFWPRRVEMPGPPPLPIYPSAQEVRQRVVASPPFCSADRNIRFTSFVTPDSPDTVKQYYYRLLVEQGAYTKSPDRDAYTQAFHMLPGQNAFPGDGFTVALLIVPGYERTVVKVREYQYQMSTHCHFTAFNNDPWDL